MYPAMKLSNVVIADPTSTGTRTRKAPSTQMSMTLTAPATPALATFEVGRRLRTATVAASMTDPPSSPGPHGPSLKLCREED